MNLKELGTRIQSAREDRKMSQEQLASAIGCSQSALSNYEQGKRRIYLSQLEKMSAVLEKPLDYFVESFAEGKPAPVSVDNNILKVINQLYLLSEDDLQEVDRFIRYLRWKRAKGEDVHGFFTK